MPSRELVVWSLLTPSHETLARDFFLRSPPAGGVPRRSLSDARG